MKSDAGNKTGRLVPDIFSFFKKEVKKWSAYNIDQKCAQLVFIF